MDRKEISYVFVSSIVFFVIEAASPTLEDLTALQCGSDRPFKCLPYGVCYNADQFCHAGLVESCFPTNVTTDQLENWCKTTGQFRPELMRDPKLCALACQARFPSLNLSNVSGHAEKYWRDVSIGVSVPLGIAVVVIFGLGCFLTRRLCCKEKSNDNYSAPGVKHKANPQDGNIIEMEHIGPVHTDDKSLAIENISSRQAAPNGQTPLNGQTAPNGQTPPNVQSDPNGQDALAGHASLNGQTASSFQETNTCFSNIIMRHKSV